MARAEKGNKMRAKKVLVCFTILICFLVNAYSITLSKINGFVGISKGSGDNVVAIIKTETSISKVFVRSKIDTLSKVIYEAKANDTFLVHYSKEGMLNLLTPKGSGWANSSNFNLYNVVFSDEELLSEFSETNNQENKQKAADHYQKARDFEKKRDYEQAIAEYTKAVFFDSTDGSFHWGLGNVYSDRFNKTANFTKAIESFKNAIKCAPNEAIYYWSLGNAYVDYFNKSKNYDDAIKMYLKAIALDPNDHYYFKSLADVYVSINDYNSAIINYNKAIKLKPNDPYLHGLLGDAYVKAEMTNDALKEFQEALNIYTKYNEKTPSDKLSISMLYTKLGDEYDRIGNTTGAIQSYKKAILTSDTIGYMQCGIKLGLVYLQSKEIENARSIFNKMIELDFDTYSAMVGLGRAYYMNNQFNDAISIYKKVTEQNPNWDPAYFHMGLAFGKLDMPEEAITAYKKALEIAPNNYSCYFNIGINYTKLSKLYDAIEAYKKAVNILPEEAEAHYYLGLAYHDINDKEKAYAEFQILRTLNDSLSSILSDLISRRVSQNEQHTHFNKALGLSKTGLYNEALNEFTLSIDENEGKPEAFLYRGGILIEKKEYEGALYNLNQAEKLGVTNWVLHYWRADVFSYQKEFRLVVKDLNKALSLLPASEVETRKEIEKRVKFIQSALDIPLVGEFLADPNKQPARQQPTYTPRKAPQFDFNFQNNTQPTQPRNQVREKETCSFCNGTGEGMQCYSCNGTGIKTENCFSCNGTGRGYSGNKCISCDGRGFKNSRCYFCNGKGYKPCTYCNGRGIR